MTDLWSEIESRMKLLDVALKEYAARGQMWAEAEAFYRSELAKEELRLKAEGMAATLIKDVAQGSPIVAKASLDRTCKEVLYKSAEEAINVYKLQLRIIENQFSREYADVSRKDRI